MKITDSYRKQQEILHIREDYGTASKVYAPYVSRLVNEFGVTELLDYGAGKGLLARNLEANHKVRIQMYDPAIPDLAGDPIPMQMCACIDVLEHIEPECLDEVLDDLKRCTQTIGFFTVSTREAEKVLSDGRNAHLIVKPVEWWLPKFLERFELQLFQKNGNDGFFVIVFAKPDASKIQTTGNA